MRLKVGQKFNSFDLFENALIEYQLETRTQYYKRDAKTLKNKEKDLQKAVKANKNLIYYYVRYSCIHGGQQCRQKNTAAIRSSSGTWRQNCRAEIKLILSEDGQELIIKDIITEHNHDIPDLKTFQQLPQQRRLTNDEKKEAALWLSLKANKKLVQAKLLANTGKNVLLRDLSNLKQAAEKEQFSPIVKLLEEKYKCTTDILVEDTEFKGLFFQNNAMAENYKKFPEIIFMDATYKLINIRCPVYILAVENSLGLTDIVGVSILMNEDVGSINWMISRFKERNSNWDKTEIIVTDKDASERCVIKKEFPNSKYIICLFHVLQIFRREVTTTKLHISSQEVLVSLKYLEKLAYASNESEYTSILENFEKVSPTIVYDYFVNNWHNLRYEWVVGFTSIGNFYNNTNNRLESLNAKLKSVIPTYSTIAEFVEKLFILLNIKQIEYDNKLSKMKLKNNTKYPNDSFQMEYYKLLTPYAFKQLEKHLNNLKFSYDFTSSNGIVTCKTSNNMYHVTESTCNCRFFQSMCLPCKHILVFLSSQNMSLFVPNLCSARWTRSYLVTHPSINYSSNDETNVVNTTSITSFIQTSKKPLTAHEKYKKASALASKLATLCSEVSTVVFYQRMKLLSELQNNWQELVEVSLNPISNNTKQIDDDKSKNILNVSRTEADDTVDNSNLISAVVTDEINFENAPNTYEWHNYCLPFNINTAISKTNAEISEECDENIKTSNFINTHDNNDNVNFVNAEGINTLDEIVLPVPVKCRGRPKGKSLTTIGLPSKKKISKPIVYSKKNNKQELIMNWIVKPNVVKLIIDKMKLVHIEDLKESELINNSLIDDEVDVTIVRSFFHSSAWSFLLSIMDQKREHGLWLCFICNTELVNNAIRCDACLEWFHLHCVALQKVPKTKTWFCHNCYV